MTQHPVRTAFDRIDEHARPEFRKNLRAQLLADLATPRHIQTTQEPIVTTIDESDSPSAPRRRRVLLGAAAVAIIAIGVTAIVINRNNADTGNANAASASQPVTITGESLLPFVGDSDPSDLEPGPPDPEIGKTAPLISGFDFQGQPITVDPATSGPYMIVFLAHWCPHCEVEMPWLLDWKASGTVPAELNVLAVSTAVSPTSDGYPPAQWFIDMGWTWPVMVDESQGDGEAGKAAEAYGTSGYPFFVIVGADGLVKARFAGEMEPSDLQAFVDNALAA